MLWENITMLNAMYLQKFGAADLTRLANDGTLSSTRMLVLITGYISPDRDYLVFSSTQACHLSISWALPSFPLASASATGIHLASCPCPVRLAPKLHRKRTVSH